MRRCHRQFLFCLNGLIWGNTKALLGCGGPFAVPASQADNGIIASSIFVPAVDFLAHKLRSDTVSTHLVFPVFPALVHVDHVDIGHRWRGSFKDCRPF